MRIEQNGCFLEISEMVSDNKERFMLISMGEKGFDVYSCRFGKETILRIMDVCKRALELAEKYDTKK